MALPRLEETQVFQVNDFRNGETVVDFSELYVFGGESGHGISLLGRSPGGLKGGQVSGGMQTVAASLPKAGHIDRLIGKISGHILSRQE
jgi:hypothetical protein